MDLTRYDKYFNTEIGYLTITGYSHQHNNKHYLKCICICGKNTAVAFTMLKRGYTQSCGCKGYDKTTAHSNELFRNYKSNAKKSNRIFNLTKEQFKYIISQNCYYCNQVPILKGRASYTKDRLFPHNGIDRINNNVGYEINNCIPCCENCNSAKLDMAYNDFLQLITNIYKHRVQQKVQ